MKAFDVMTSNLVAAQEGTTAREIDTTLLIGNFNGLPVIDSSIKVLGIVTIYNKICNIYILRFNALDVQTSKLF